MTAAALPVVRSSRRRRLAIGLGAGVLASTALLTLPAAPSHALPPQCVTLGVQVTCTFTGPPGTVFPSLFIPEAVTSIQVHAVGARGGNSNGAPGGLPARVDATIPVVEGEAYGVQLRNDGGPASGAAGRGGGSSVVLRGSVPLVQAAGGGGAGQFTSGGGGSFGGNAGQPGANGTGGGFGPGAVGGQPGGPSSGGAGGPGAVVSNCSFGSTQFPGGQFGSSVFGGAGASAPAGGGGGGGGRFGGGGGGGGGIGCFGDAANGAGGGGGSSLVPTGGGLTLTSSESAIVQIGFTLKPRSAFSPSALAFGSAEVGTASATQSVSVTNTGSAPLSVGIATLSGVNADQFAKVSDTCSGASVAPGHSCEVGVRLEPTAVGNHQATLAIPDNSPTSPHVVALSGAGTPPADLKVLGAGSVYSGRDQLVTRTVTGPGKLTTYKLGVLNEDTVGRSYRIRLTTSGAMSVAEVWTSTFLARKLPVDGGDYITPVIGPGKLVTFALRVTPTAPGQTISAVDATLLTDSGAAIEGVRTQTNTAAPVAGSTGYELFAKQGGDPYIGGPVSGQTTNAPALNVGQTATYTVRLKNDGGGATRIGLKLTDLSACTGSFTPTVKAGFTNVTAAAVAGTYQTPLLAPGRYTTLTVNVKRATAGCRSAALQLQSLDAGAPVRTSHLRTNAAYNAVAD